MKILLFGLFFFSSLLVADMPGLYIVEYENGIVRSSPTSDGDEVKRLMKGKMVVVEDSGQGNWYKLDDEKYIYKKALKRVDKNNIYSLVVQKDNSRIRFSPKILETNIIRDDLRKGEILYGISEIRNWYILVDGSFIWKKSVVREKWEFELFIN